VHAFEADPATASRLDQNARTQPNGRVRVIHAAVSDTTGQVRISGESTMLTRVIGDGATTVPSVRLDDYVAEQGLSRIDLIKVDVEGHELQVLRGSEALIQRFRPTFVCEAAGHADDNAVARFLLDRGYRLRPIPPIGMQRLRPGADLDRNVAFLPQ
jgi:FkbM family methyltransferase